MEADSQIPGSDTEPVGDDPHSLPHNIRTNESERTKWMNEEALRHSIGIK